MRNSRAVFVLFVAMPGAAPLLASCLSSDNTAPSGADAGTFDAPSPTDDALPSWDGNPPTDGASPSDTSPSGDTSPQPDAPGATYAGGANDSTATVALPTSIQPILYGAASDDGSAMLILSSVNGGSLYWSHYDVATGWTNVAPIAGAPFSSQLIRGSVGIDAKGNAFFAWIGQDASSVSSLYVARYDHASQAWGAATNLDPYCGQSFFSPLSVSPSGEALVLDVRGGTPDAGVGRDVVAHHFASGAWTSEVVQTEASTVPVYPLQVSFSDSGFAAALWDANYTAGVATRSVTTTATWTAGPTVTGSGIGAGGPSWDLAVNGSGDALLAFASYATAAPQVYQRDGVSQKWAGPTSVDPTHPGTSQCYPTLGGMVATLTSTGNGGLARCLYDGSNHAVAIASVTYTKASATWGTPALTATQAAGTSTGMDVAYDGTGNALGIFGYTPEGGAGGLFTSTDAPGAAWATSNGPIGGTASGGQVFASPSGRAWAVWLAAGGASVKKVK